MQDCAKQTRTQYAKPLRSIASRFSLFTAALVFWVVAAIFGYDLRHETFNVFNGVLLCVVLVLIAATIARFIIGMLVRPLIRLQAGITSVRNGKLLPVEVSRTGDEIEFLAESFNGMIAALAASKEDILRQQDLLEERIRGRTEQLQEITLRAEAASNAKSEFLANMSHELRTPMNGVIGMIDLALEGPLSREQRSLIETSQQCAYSLLALLNDILDLSKIEAGKMALEKIPFDIRSMVGDCVRAQLPTAAKKALDLYSEIDPSVPRDVIGDPLRMRQILSNLLTNALKFTDSGFIMVRLSAEPASPEELLLRLDVEDTGCGIPAAKLPYLFEKFTQADGSVSRKYGGTGLGLAISRKLAEMYGGGIKVQSEEGSGSRFSVTVKCGVPPAGIVSNLAATAAASVPVSPPHPARILVVEDNPVNQKVVTAVLTKRGYALELANDGREAISKLEAADFDLILMDVQMPVLDGLEATRLIRKEERWSRLPILAMTAHAMNGDRERCLEAGMTDYISKPVHPSHLLQTIEDHLCRELVGQSTEVRRTLLKAVASSI